jgi:hypothetical protein
MTNRSSRIQKIGLGAAFLAVCTFGLASAKPPAPPASPPPGSIIYHQPGAAGSGQIGTDNQMKADGSGKAAIAPGLAFKDWSYSKYGADGARWCLGTENIPNAEIGAQAEIFAYRVVNGVVDRRVQLTDFYPAMGVWDTNSSRLTKGSDGFISTFCAEYIPDEFGIPVELGRTQFHRVNVAIADLESATSNGRSFTPVTIGDPRLTQVFDDTSSASCDFAWSPDGSTLAWAQNSILKLYRGLGTATPSVVQVPTTAYTVNWSAAGDKIAVHGQPHNLAVGGLVSVDPIANTATLVKADSTSGNYWQPKWSTQGEYLVATKIFRKKSGSSESTVVRLNANGSGELTLHSFGSLSNPTLYDWVSDDVAP